MSSQNLLSIVFEILLLDVVTHNILTKALGTSRLTAWAHLLRTVLLVHIDRQSHSSVIHSVFSF